MARAELHAHAQGKALAEEVGRVHRQAESAADRLESLLRERDADRTRLAEVQQALQEAMQHLKDLSNDAQVRLHLPSLGCHATGILLFMVSIYSGQTCCLPEMFQSPDHTLQKGKASGMPASTLSILMHGSWLTLGRVCRALTASRQEWKPRPRLSMR